MKVITRIFIILHLFTSSLFSQAPHAFKYQAVARNASGSILSNATLNVRVGLRDLSATGTIVYQETHAVTTNSFGLINLNIGKGSVTTGTFTNIAWSSGDKFIEIDIDYGSGYISMGTSQLLSVPYALYAASGATGPIGPQGLNGISVVWLGSFSSAPPSPVMNNAYYDTTQKKSFLWNGSSWQMITQDGLPGSVGPSILPTWQFVSVSATINATTDFVMIAHGTNNPQFTLPPCSSVPQGKVIIFKRTRIIGSTLAGDYYINTSGTDKIDCWGGVISNSQVYMSGNPYENGVMRLVSDGVSTWHQW